MQFHQLKHHVKKVNSVHHNTHFKDLSDVFCMRATPSAAIPAHPTLHSTSSKLVMEAVLVSSCEILDAPSSPTGVVWNLGCVLSVRPWGAEGWGDEMLQNEPNIPEVFKCFLDF